MSYPNNDRVTSSGVRVRDNRSTVSLKKDIAALGHLSFTLLILVLCLFSGWLGSAGVFS